MNPTKIHFTIHAHTRMEQRGISEQAVLDVLRLPDAVETNGELLVAKKRSIRAGMPHMLLVFYYVRTDGVQVVITTIDTSKVAKYS